MQPTCVLGQDTEMHVLVAEGEGVLRQPAHAREEKEKGREGKGRTAAEEGCEGKLQKKATKRLEREIVMLNKTGRRLQKHSYLQSMFTAAGITRTRWGATLQRDHACCECETLVKCRFQTACGTFWMGKWW